MRKFLSNKLTLITLLVLGTLLVIGINKYGFSYSQAANIAPLGNTLQDRISLPDGYQRLPAEPNSIATYFRQLPLKPSTSKVYLYNGQEKWNQNAHAAVLDYDIGKKDLLQCADAAMMLQAEYLYHTSQAAKIHFNFTNGFVFYYSKWKDGFRPSSNYKTWVKKQTADNSYASFRKYLDMAYTYAGSSSLSKELKHVPITDMKIGDVLVIGGFPGHVVTVMDMAINTKTNQKIYLLSQSYMPAQQVHILKNLEESALSPWYTLPTSNGTIHTPEYTFETTDLMRFNF